MNQNLDTNRSTADLPNIPDAFNPVPRRHLYDRLVALKSPSCRQILVEARYKKAHNLYTYSVDLSAAASARWREGEGCRCGRYNFSSAVRPRADEPRRRLTHGRQPS